MLLVGFSKLFGAFYILLCWSMSIALSSLFDWTAPKLNPPTWFFLFLCLYSPFLDLLFIELHLRPLTLVVRSNIARSSFLVISPLFSSLTLEVYPDSLHPYNEWTNQHPLCNQFYYSIYPHKHTIISNQSQTNILPPCFLLFVWRPAFCFFL